ncbi:hypothetical protein MCC93_05690 [Morococcus cerebrosus]|uniref:Uncharacterized protein n=1 Tax=Morococcus cerebrosus TaxID=1056807 RepID=A0A0C1GZ03_9NEIS|nr:hypothetical protein MCC93_05690 [Morococcus cerebrosus]
MIQGLLNSRPCQYPNTKYTKGRLKTCFNAHRECRNGFSDDLFVIFNPIGVAH